MFLKLLLPLEIILHVLLSLETLETVDALDALETPNDLS